MSIDRATTLQWKVLARGLLLPLALVTLQVALLGLVDFGNLRGITHYHRKCSVPADRACEHAMAEHLAAGLHARPHQQAARHRHEPVPGFVSLVRVNDDDLRTVTAPGGRKADSPLQGPFGPEPVQRPSRIHQNRTFIGEPVYWPMTMLVFRVYRPPKRTARLA